MELREHYLNHSAKNRESIFSQLTFITSLTIALLLSYLFFTFPCNAEEKPQQVKKILLLHSFEPFLPYSITVNQSILSTLESDKTIHADMYTEYLDLTQFPDKIYHKRIHNLLRHKYSKRPPDLIFVMLNPALDFFMKNVEDLFPGTTVVFCTIEKYQLANIQLNPNITGVLMEIDPKNTLEAALKLQPDARNVVVVGGAHKNDRGYEAVVKEVFKNYEKKLNITYLTGMPMAEILGKVSTLPKQTLVLFVTMFQD